MNPFGALDTVLALAIIGALLVAGVWALRRASALVSLRRRHRTRFGRLVPLLEVMLVVAAVLLVATVLLDAQPAPLTAFVIVVVGLLLAAGWFAVRDVVAGAVLRAEDSFAAGQWLRAGEVEGRIRSVGMRSLEIERDDGTRARLPYARLASASLIRAGGTEDSSGHTFSIALPAERTPVRVLPVIRAAARNCFFVSATREPLVHVTSGPEGHRYDITVFTLDRTFLPEIEAAVRQRIEGERAHL